MGASVTETKSSPLNLALCWAALFGLLAVAMGAFAAHGLRGVLAPDSLQTVQTAVQYQMWHALALLAVARLPACRWRRLASLFFIGGVIAFSGSLYAMVFTPLRPGLVTPLGGLLLMAGWLTLLLMALGRKDRRQP